VEEHEHGTQERSHHLAGDVDRHLSPFDAADHRHPERHGRVQVRAADGSGDENAAEDGERPRHRDHDPAAVLGLGSVEQHPGDDAVAQENEGPRAKDLGQEYVHCHSLLTVMPCPSEGSPALPRPKKKVRASTSLPRRDFSIHGPE
jgi:hypothetical protein